MPISTLIVDDTVVYRKILSDVVTQIPALALSGTAASGSIALQKISRTPVDLVLLDVHMPEMDGVEVLRRIRAQFPQTYVVMISGISTRSAAITIEALQLGAIDFIRKPDGPDAAANMGHLVNDLRAVVRVIELKLQTRHLTSDKPAAAPQLRPPMPAAPPPGIPPRITPTRFAVCVIGVSTGGPEALNRLIPLLPATLKVPVLLVQHMPPGFTKSLADSLAKKSKIRVVEATEGERIEAGTVYIAPGGRHMVARHTADSLTIGLNDEPPENSCRPSVDVLFRSVASAYSDKGVLAVILTGMGSDGCNGVRTLKRRGCYCITQDNASCVVYGMPRAVDEAQLSDQSLPLEKIAETIGIKVQ